MESFTEFQYKSKTQVYLFLSATSLVPVIRLMQFVNFYEGAIS